MALASSVGDLEVALAMTSVEVSALALEVMALASSVGALEVTLAMASLRPSALALEVAVLPMLLP